MKRLLILAIVLAFSGEAFAGGVGGGAGAMGAEAEGYRGGAGTISVTATKKVVPIKKPAVKKLKPIKKKEKRK